MRSVPAGDELVHGYAVIDDGLVWGAATTRAPGLAAQLDALLADAVP